MSQAQSIESRGGRAESLTISYRCALLNAITTVAFGLLENGAEIYRVEDSTQRMFAAYGRPDADIFAIPGSIIITIYDEDGRPWTKTRRVLRRANDFDKLARLNALCRYICQEKPDCGEILRRYEEINRRPVYRFSIRLLAVALVSAGFALMFKASLGDAFAAGLIGLAALLLIQFMDYFKTNNVFTTIAASGLIMGLALFAVRIGLAHNADLVAISVLMNLVPGSLLTYAIRDIIAGDLLSGVTRLAEAFLVAAAIAVGAGVALYFLSGFFGSEILLPVLAEAGGAGAVAAGGAGAAVGAVAAGLNQPGGFLQSLPASLPSLWELALSVLYAFIACFGFSLTYNVRSKMLFFAPLGAGLSWLVYRCTGFLGGDLVQYFLGAVALSIYAEAMARVEKVPVTVVMLISLLPLVPGGGIYYTMEHCIRGDADLFLSTGIHTLAIAGTLALGILLVSTIVRLWSQVAALRRQQKTRKT